MEDLLWRLLFLVLNVSINVTQIVHKGVVMSHSQHLSDDNLMDNAICRRKGGKGRVVQCSHAIKISKVPQWNIYIEHVLEFESNVPESWYSVTTFLVFFFVVVFSIKFISLEIVIFAVQVRNMAQILVHKEAVRCGSGQTFHCQRWAYCKPKENFLAIAIHTPHFTSRTSSLEIKFSKPNWNCF